MYPVDPVRNIAIHQFRSSLPPEERQLSLQSFSSASGPQSVPLGGGSASALR
jgi:hypothetical protein